MYTPLIGRRLLDRANARDGRDRTPAEFFTEEFHRLVFDDDDYLMPAGNSKFGQLVNNRKKHQAAAEREGRAWDDAERSRLRADALADFHAVAAETTEPQSHLVLGGYARGTDGTTSGQVTGIDHAAGADEVYLSWIGAAAGAGVSGGLVLLIDHDAVLDAVLEGWAHYRRVLRESGGTMRPNQLETWNGQWLRHRFSPRYDPGEPTLFVTTDPDVLNTKKTPSQLDTVPWARLLFALGHGLDAAEVPAYVYSTGQTNTTVGFVTLHLGATEQVRAGYRTLRGHYRQLFGSAADGLAAPDDLDAVYDAGRGFVWACAEGTVGLSALQPRKLRDFLPGGKNRQPKPVGPADAQTPLLYQSWIYAMLGDKQSALYDRARETAERFLAFESGAIGGKTNLSKSVHAVLKSASIQEFVDGLARMAEDAQEASKSSLTDEQVAGTLDALDGLVRDTLDLDYERFRLFLTLLRFQLALLRGRAAHAG